MRNKDNGKGKIIVICGPTGIGKTGFAVKLSRQFNGQIISADSMQIYSQLDIGTAKPTKEEQSLAPHHMINIIEPDMDYDANKFSKEGRSKIDQLLGKNILPFVVGGTGFYIKALLQGLFKPVKANPEVRAQLKREFEEKGVKALHDRLEKCDPKAALELHPNDTYRVIRALEIYLVSGQPITKLQSRHGFEENYYQTLKIGLQMDRELLYKRINQRVDQMIKDGFLDEVKTLLQKGYKRDLKSMQSIGYRHLIAFIDKRLSWEEAITTLKRDTRRYAKRQLTWFKADKEIVWLAPNETTKSVEMINQFTSSNTGKKNAGIMQIN